MIKQRIETIEGPINLEIKTSLSDITVDQYERVISAINGPKNDIGKVVEIICILSGCEESTILQATEVDKTINSLLKISNSIIEGWDVDIAAMEQKNDKGEPVIIIPPQVRFDNFKKTFNVEKNLSFYPLGARIAAENIIKEELEMNGIKTDSGEQLYKISIKAGIEILAHYFYCGVTGMPYNDIAVLTFMAEIRLIKAIDFLALNKYFFLAYPNFSPTKLKFWQGTKVQVKARLNKQK